MPTPEATHEQVRSTFREVLDKLDRECLGRGLLKEKELENSGFPGTSLYSAPLRRELVWAAGLRFREVADSLLRKSESGRRSQFVEIVCRAESAALAEFVSAVDLALGVARSSVQIGGGGRAADRDGCGPAATTGEGRSEIEKVIDAARSAWAGSRVVVHCETARTPGLPSRSYVARVFVQKSAKRRTFESRPEDLFRAARLFGKFVDEVLRTDPRTWWVRWGLDRCEYSFSAINDDHVKAMRRRLVLPADRLLELNRACDAVRAIEFPHGEKLEGVRDLRSLAEANGLGTDGLFQPARLAHVEGRVEREVQTMDAAAAREHGACTLTLIRQLLQRVADGTLRFSRDDDWLSQARRRQPQPLQPPGLEAPPTQYGPLSIETAAKILSCDRSTLYRWMQDGRCGKKGGPSPLERKQSVEDGTGGRSGNRYYLIESRLDAEAQLRLGEHKAKVSQKFGRGGVDPSAKPNE